MRYPMILLAVAAGAILSLGTGSSLGAGALAPANLRCEYLTNPLGVDVPAPRLAWIVESGQRNQKQSAYQVLAASEAQTLAGGKGDLWDSGKVESDQTTDIVYAGKALASHQQVFWTVRVWDAAGQPSEWARPVMFAMGLLPGTEFTGQWIGYDKPRANTDRPEADFGKAKWIGFAGDTPMKAPKGARVYMTSFTIPAGATVSKSSVVATGDDSCHFSINGEEIFQIHGYNNPRQIEVNAQLKPGLNIVRAQVENGSEGPTGLLARITVTTSDGKTIDVVTDESWRATDKPGENWHNREIAADAWPAARAVANYGDKPWGKLKVRSLVLTPPPYLRGTFKAPKPVKRAVLYVTGLGIFDAYLNGQRVSDDFFNPGWTDYVKRVYYRAYDVTGQVKQGENVLGAILADGWYSGYVGYGNNRDHYGKKPRFASMLHLEYQDGTAADIASGPEFKAAVGPIAEADFLMGETYDARKELAGWSAAGFDDAKWDPVDLGAEFKPLVQWHPAPAVRPFEEIRAAKVTQPVAGGPFVLDMGQNFAGVPRLKISGAEAGQKIVLRFAERLNPDGTIYVTNLRSARTTDTYICRGGGEEIYVPRFTFHGFQYAEISGLKGAPSADTLVGIALASETPVAGSFTCSDAMLNRLHKNIYYTQRMNFIDIPTDCPQRDERLGWTGDAQVYIRTATLNADTQAFFNKWLVDLADGQREDGQFPMVAPVKVAGNDGGPAWADAGAICPWTVYEVYGDTRVLARQYPTMKKFIAFCQKRSTPDLLPPAKYHCFGDWLSINADTPKDIIYTAYFAYSTKLTARAAQVLGKADEAKQYEELFNRIKGSFNKAYVREDGRIGITGKDGKFAGDTQTCYVLAIAFDLLDEAKFKLAAQHLVENIKARGYHLSTGFIGTKDLMLALAKINRNDVAYRLLHNESFPSWGFSIKHGATSIWERWDGWTPEKGFQTPGMNSFAHYSFGAVYQWMVENIAGIRSASPTYKTITIAPRPGGKLTSASTRYTSLRGTIESSWKLDGPSLTLTVTIPANTTATVLVPTKDAASVTESGKPVGQSGLKVLPAVDGALPVEVGSGTYTFTAACAPIPMAE